MLATGASAVCCGLVARLVPACFITVKYGDNFLDQRKSCTFHWMGETNSISAAPCIPPLAAHNTKRRTLHKETGPLRYSVPPSGVPPSGVFLFQCPPSPAHNTPLARDIQRLFSTLRPSPSLKRLTLLAFVLLLSTPPTPRPNNLPTKPPCHHFL